MKAGTKSWGILQHVEWEGPGLIAAEAVARGVSLDLRRLDGDRRVPNAGDMDGLVVMGGPMGVYETDKYAFLAEECNLIREMVRRDRPVLGVCLGAQLLASALGARVFPGHGPEVGFGAVALTEKGSEDPVLGPAGPSLPVFHWHGDTFDLPDSAVLLASSTKYANQAFRVGRCTYGLQFHVEPDDDTWSVWREHLPTKLSVQDKQVRSAIQRIGKGVIQRFFDLALGDVSLSDEECAISGR